MTMMSTTTSEGDIGLGGFSSEVWNETTSLNTTATLSVHYWGLSVVFLPLFTALGNVLVILSVTQEKVLQTSTNFLIVSLAVADLFVALFVMPWGIYLLVYDLWTLPFFLCDLYIAMDVICSTASIFNLVAISMDRYQAVMKPMQYAQDQATKASHSRIMRHIFTAWFVATGLGTPILLGLNATPATTEETQTEMTECKFYNPDFIILSSLASFYVPCVILLVVNYKIIKAFLKRSNKGASKNRNRKKKKKKRKEKSSVVVLGNGKAEGEGATSSNKIVQTTEHLRSSVPSFSWRRFRVGYHRPKVNRDEGDGNKEGDGGVDDVLAGGRKKSAIEAEEEEGNGGVLLPGSKQPKRQRRRRRPSAPAHHLGVSCLFKQILRMSTNPLEKDFDNNGEVSGEAIVMRNSIGKRRNERIQSAPQTALSPPPPQLMLPKESRNGVTSSSPQERRERSPSVVVVDEDGYRRSSSDSSSPEAPISEREDDDEDEDEDEPNRISYRVRCLEPRRRSSAASSLASHRNSIAAAGAGCVIVVNNQDAAAAAAAVGAIASDASNAVAAPSSSASLGEQRLKVPGGVENGAGDRRPSIGSTIKVLRRAATWKIRSQERLQAKRERRERRATKTLAIVLGSFLFCWIPFFTCNILSAISLKTGVDQLQPTMTLFILTTWLGYVNSALNPIIYTIFNREFRKAFKKIMVCWATSAASSETRTRAKTTPPSSVGDARL